MYKNVEKVHNTLTSTPGTALPTYSLHQTTGNFRTRLSAADYIPWLEERERDTHTHTHARTHTHTTYLFIADFKGEILNNLLFSIAGTWNDQIEIKKLHN